MTDQIYSARYSGVDVYEFIHSTGSIMKRKDDDWVNATHILKAANFPKAKRTRILEKEVIKDTHEKVQGGFGKYQGTWVPLDIAKGLASKFEVYEELKLLFDFSRSNGSASPPPAPKHHHASKQDPTRKRATKSSSTSALMDSKKLDDIKKAVPSVPRKRGRPPSLATQKKRLMEAAAKRSKSDTGAQKVATRNSSISSNQLPNLMHTKSEMTSVDQQVLQQHQEQLQQQVQQHQSQSRQLSLSQQSQFKELDLNDGLSSDVEHQYPIENDNLRKSNESLDEQNNKEFPQQVRQYSMADSNQYEENSPTVSTPTLPTSPSELSDTGPFENRYVVGTSPVLSTIACYPAPPRIETSDINDKVNQYLSSLVDYFTSTELKNTDDIPQELLLPPPNGAPYIDAPIDPELHNAFHWACSMGNLPIIEALYNVGTNIRATNTQGQTPLMRSVMFHNCYTRRSFPRIFHLLNETVFDLDINQQSIIHHIIKRKSSTPSAVYYLDLILSKVKDYSPKYRIDLWLNTQDSNGSTAMHIAAKNGDKVFYNTLLEFGAADKILNRDGFTAQDLLNQHSRTVDNQMNIADIQESDLFGTYITSQEPGKHDVGNFQSKSANYAMEKVGDLVDTIKKLADHCNTSVSKSENERKALAKNIMSVMKSIKNVNVRTAEILKISNVNEIEEVLQKQTKSIESLNVERQEMRQKLFDHLERKHTADLKKFIKAEVSVKETKSIENNNEDIKSAMEQELNEVKNEQKNIIKEMVDSIMDNSKIHKYRKIISEGTGVEALEVDGCLDIILQTLMNDNETKA